MAFVCNPTKIEAAAKRMGQAKKPPFSLEIGETLNEQALNESGAVGETKRKFGSFMNWRTARGVFGEAAAPWWNNVVHQTTRMHNEDARELNKLFDLVKPLQPGRLRVFGLKADLDTKLTSLLRQIRGNEYVGAVGAFTDAEIQVGKNIRGWFDNLHATVIFPLKTLMIQTPLHYLNV